MADQGELVSVGALGALQERGKGMTAGVRREAVPAVLIHRVLYAQTLQQFIKLRAVILQAHGLAQAAEDAAAVRGGDQTVDVLLDLRRDGHGAPLPCCRFDSADEAAPVGVIIVHSERQECGGTEAQVTVTKHDSGKRVARCGRIPHKLQLGHGQAGLFAASRFHDPEELRYAKRMGL